MRSIPLCLMAIMVLLAACAAPAPTPKPLPPTPTSSAPKINPAPTPSPIPYPTSTPRATPTMQPSPTPTSTLQLSPVVTATPVAQGTDIDWKQVEIVSSEKHQVCPEPICSMVWVTYRYKDIDKGLVIIPIKEYTEETVKEKIAESIYYQTDFLTPPGR